MKVKMPTYSDEEKSVLEIKFEDGSKMYLNSGCYMTVANPSDATRYYPLDDNYPERANDRKIDTNWMNGSYEAEINFVPYLSAIKDYKKIT